MAKMKAPKTEKSLVIAGARYVLGFLGCLSIGKRISRGHPFHHDIYSLSWLLVQVATIGVVAVFSPGGAFPVVIFALFGYRLFEILVNSFQSIIIAVVEHERHESAGQLVGLVIVNYLEIMVIFGVFFSFLGEGATVAQSLSSSVALATLSGLTVAGGSGALFFIGILEMLFGIFFIAGAIAVLANYLGTRE